MRDPYTRLRRIESAAIAQAIAATEEAPRGAREHWTDRANELLKPLGDLTEDEAKLLESIRETKIQEYTTDDN